MSAAGGGGKRPLTVMPSAIANKQKRAEVFAKVRLAKKEAKRERREARRAEDEAGGGRPKAAPRTLENTRTFDDAVVAADDEEVLADEAEDEFADIFRGTETPKVMITTQRSPSGKVFGLIGELLSLIPNAFYYRRGPNLLGKISVWAAARGFTHLLVLVEKSKATHTLILSRLVTGPTACFKYSSPALPTEIKGHGTRTTHVPEIILNGFTTRLGRRVGRLLGSVFPHKPAFQGRQVATFHNQRDFIFFRQHRYIFEEREEAEGAKPAGKGGKGGKAAEAGPRVRLQELGPRFTLKLRWLLAGPFDPLHGEYEWLYKRTLQDATRRTFQL